MRLWQVYEEAILALEQRMERGEAIRWQPSRGEPGMPMSVRWPPEVMDAMKRIAEAQGGIAYTVVLLTALHHYLSHEP